MALQVFAAGKMKWVVGLISAVLHLEMVYYLTYCTIDQQQGKFDCEIVHFDPGKDTGKSRNFLSQGHFTPGIDTGS